MDVDPGEEAECEAARTSRGEGAGCDNCPGLCSMEGVECHEVSCSLIGPGLKYWPPIGVCLTQAFKTELFIKITNKIIITINC